MLAATSSGTWWSAALVAALCLYLAAIALPVSSLRSELRCERAGQCVQTQSVLGWQSRRAFSASELMDARLGSELAPRRSGDRPVYFVELLRHTGSTIQLLPKAESSQDPQVVKTLQQARAFLRGDVSSFRHEKGFGAFEAMSLLFGLGMGALGFHFARTSVRRARRGRNFAFLRIGQ
jgi:hypothetical protein